MQRVVAVKRHPHSTVTNGIEPTLADQVHNVTNP